MIQIPRIYAIYQLITWIHCTTDCG